MCILLKDNEIKAIKSKQELEEYLDFRSEYDRWLISPVSRMKILTNTGSAADFKKQTGSRASEECISECTKEGTNLFLRFITEINGVKKRGTIPLRYTAVRSLLDRARISGLSITNETEEADIHILSLKDKTEIINKCLPLYEQQSKVLIRDEKISAIMSGQYAILGEKEIVWAVENGLEKDFPYYEFLNGYVSHESFRAEYALHADEIEEDLMLLFDEFETGAESIKAKLGVFTSDIGSAAATIYAYLDVDGHSMSLGRAYSIKHIGNKTSADISKAVNKIYSMFKSRPDDLRALMETKIHNPSGCLRLIAREYKLPKKYAMSVAEELDSKELASCTAYEIFWYLNEIVKRFSDEKKDVFRTMLHQEAVAETIKLDFRRFDEPFHWSRSENTDND